MGTFTLVLGEIVGLAVSRSFHYNAVHTFTEFLAKMVILVYAFALSFFQNQAVINLIDELKLGIRFDQDGVSLPKLVQSFRELCFFAAEARELELSGCLRHIQVINCLIKNRDRRLTPTMSARFERAVHEQVSDGDFLVILHRNVF